MSKCFTTDCVYLFKMDSGLRRFGLFALPFIPFLQLLCSNAPIIVVLKFYNKTKLSAPISLQFVS